MADVLQSLLDCEGSQGHITSFLGTKYILSWGLDDHLGQTPTSVQATDSKDNSDKDKEKGIFTLGYF